MVNWLWLLVALVIGFAIGWFLCRALSRQPDAGSQPVAASTGTDHESTERIRALEAELAECRSARATTLVAEPSAVAEASPAVVAEPSPAVAEPTPVEPVLDLTAAATALGRTVKLNDLKVVEGIGPKIEQLILAEGILTWRDLSNSDVSVLQRLLADAGPRFRMHDPSSWPRQAKLLADGEWAAFSTLTSELNGGR
jgi:predicted flap endonuclease-1-like 5' DNA nuclease